MKIYTFRLFSGMDLKQELKRLTREQELRAGVILTCVGSLSKVNLRMAGATPAEKTELRLEENVEIISLVGTLCQDGIHVHVGLAKQSGECVGGHLQDGCIVKTTAELVIAELPSVVFERVADKETGFGELSVSAR